MRPFRPSRLPVHDLYELFNTAGLWSSLRRTDVSEPADVTMHLLECLLSVTLFINKEQQQLALV